MLATEQWLVVATLLSCTVQGISPFSLAPAGSFGSEASLASRAAADSLFKHMRSQSQAQAGRFPARPESVLSAQSAAPKLESTPRAPASLEGKQLQLF